MTHILWAWLKQNESKRKEKIAYEMPYKHSVPFELYSDNQYQWVKILQKRNIPYVLIKIKFPLY